MALEMEYQI